MACRAWIMEGPARMESQQASQFLGKRIHLVGIGGSGMSGLARMLLDAGAIVSGTDPKENLQTRLLRQRGASVSCVQDGALLSGDMDLVVRSAAVRDDNPEMARAMQLGLPHMKYAELVGLVMRERLGVAVSGAHGKTTTTAMISYALLKCGADPSFIIGGTVPQLGGASRSGSGRPFVVEACEFDRSFHNYWPTVAVITNIDAEHLDCYRGGMPEIIESFRQFASRVPAAGRIIANGTDDRVRQAVEGLAAPVEYVGIGDSPSLTWSTRITGISQDGYRGTLFRCGRQVAELRLSVAGEHNLFNATAAVAACKACGLDPDRAAAALETFAGVDRRMTVLGTCNGATVIDDYGHHPTEIRATLKALRERFRPRRLICVFQPHQYSRTRLLLDAFGTSFADATLTILPDIYPARDSEADRRSVTPADVVDRIRRNGGEAVYITPFPAIIEYLSSIARPGDVIVTMGAGDIHEVGERLVVGYNEREGPRCLPASA